MREVELIARKEVAQKSSWWQALKRSGTRVQVVGRWRLLREYRRSVVAMSLYGGAVDKKGGDFLKEILTGQSHCGHGDL